MIRPALLIAALALLAGCEGLPPPGGTRPAEQAAVLPPPPIDLNAPPVMAGRVGGTDPATGLDRLAIVNLVPKPAGLGVYYREAAVTPADIAAVPRHVCDARGGTVASATTRDPETPNELPGVRILTVNCTLPAPTTAPAAPPAATSF